MAPQVLQDPLTGQHFYIDPTTGTRFNAVNGQWVAQPVQQVAPAPAAPATPVAPVGPDMSQYSTQIGVAPGTVPVAQVPGGMNPAAALSQMMTGGPVTGPSRSSGLFADMGDVSDGSFRTIPEGTDVEAVIAEIEVVQAKSDNQEQLKMTLKVCFPEAFEGVTIWEYIKLDEKSRWKFKRLCRVTGHLDASGSRFTGQSHVDFKNDVIRFKVRNEEYNGIPTNKIAGTYEEAYQTPGLNTVAAQAAVQAATMGMVPGQPQMGMAPGMAPNMMPGAPVAAQPQMVPGQPSWPAVPGGPVVPGQ